MRRVATQTPASTEPIAVRMPAKGRRRSDRNQSAPEAASTMAYPHSRAATVRVPKIDESHVANTTSGRTTNVTVDALAGKKRNSNRCAQAAQVEA